MNYFGKPLLITSLLGAFHFERAGTGGSISFGLQPEGEYSAKAVKRNEYKCELIMLGSVIVINSTNIPEISTGADLTIFPNPGTEVFYVETGVEFDTTRATVYAIDGKEVLETYVSTSSSGAFSIVMPKETIKGLHFFASKLSNGRVLSGKLTGLQKGVR